MPSLAEPLDQEDLARIIEGIERSDEIIKAINRATRVGIELDSQLAEVKERRRQLINLKNEYFFPNRFVQNLMSFLGWWVEGRKVGSWFRFTRLL